MGKIKYCREHRLIYLSKRYGKYVTVPAGFGSDGATCAPDIHSNAWWVHDVLCKTGRFDDGTLCTNWQASRILGDILWQEKQWLRAFPWGLMTFLFGGDKARENGMFSLRNQ